MTTWNNATQNLPSAPATQPDRSGWAIAALVVGFLNLIAWLLPICGGPLALVGIVAGVLGLKSSRRGMAIAGLVLALLGLLLSVGNALFGVYLAIKKQAQSEPTKAALVQPLAPTRKPQQPQPAALPTSAASVAQPQPAAVAAGAALDVRYSTSPATPAKGQPFQFELAVSNLAGERYQICAVNFRGNITSIYDGLVSPSGQDYWVSSAVRFEQGAILAPCVTVAPGAAQKIVFRMTSYVSNATWSGQVGLCSDAPSEENPELVLDKCVYLPVSVVVR